MQGSGARARSCVVGNGGQKSGREATARGSTQKAAVSRPGTGSAGQRFHCTVRTDSRTGLGERALSRGARDEKKMEEESPMQAAEKLRLLVKHLGITSFVLCNSTGPSNNAAKIVARRRAYSYEFLCV